MTFLLKIVWCHLLQQKNLYAMVYDAPLSPIVTHFPLSILHYSSISSTWQPETKGWSHTANHQIIKPFIKSFQYPNQTSCTYERGPKTHLEKMVASRLRLAGSSCVVKDLAPDSGAGVNIPRRSKVRYRYTCRRAVKPGLRSIACPEKNRHTVAHTQKTSIHYIIVSHSFVWKRWYSGAQSFELYNLI